MNGPRPPLLHVLFTLTDRKCTAWLDLMWEVVGHSDPALGSAPKLRATHCLELKVMPLGLSLDLHVTMFESAPLLAWP